MTTPNFSAIKAANREPVKPWEYPNSGEAFVWDVFSRKNLPPAYDSCDCIVVIPPWPAGFRFFENAAGVSDHREYRAFIGQVEAIIEAHNKPTAIMLPSQAERFFTASFLESTTTTSEKWLDGGTVTFAFRKTKPPAHDGTCIGMVKAMAKSFECVGDFLCGYGLNGRIFAESGKRYVMSDYNQKCIDYLTGKR